MSEIKIKFDQVDMAALRKLKEYKEALFTPPPEFLMVNMPDETREHVAAIQREIIRLRNEQYNELKALEEKKEHILAHYGAQILKMFDMLTQLEADSDGDMDDMSEYINDMGAPAYPPDEEASGE